MLRRQAHGGDFANFIVGPCVSYLMELVAFVKARDLVNELNAVLYVVMAVDKLNVLLQPPQDHLQLQ